MFFKILMWLFAITAYFSTQTNCFEMNMTDYYKMPSLYDFDDYDRCLTEFNNLSTYCFVRADVIPKNDSVSWRVITEISKYDKHHFNHRHLYFGLCVKWCEDALSQFGENGTDELFAGILTNNTKVNVYLNLFSSEAANRDHYNILLNKCLNLRLQQKYGLKAESVIEYCNTNNKTIEEDSWNLSFYILVYVLICLVILSSSYDFYLKHKCNDKVLTDRDHYKAPQNTLVKKICVTFSVARNWYRLTQEPTGKIGRDLRFLDCFKFFCMFLVVFAHTNWVLFEGPISNPYEEEQLLHTLSGTLLISGGLITLTFFVISGLLLTINWLALTKIKSELSFAEYIEAFTKFNIFRYIRLTVPYGFVLLLSGVYFENSGGPMWRHILEREQLSCRKNWWTNLLYVNNYVNNNERCMLQGWYLAADTHSFVLSLVLLMLANKWPKIRNSLFGVVLAIFYVIPGIIAYVKKYSPIFIATPQAQRDSFIENEEFANFYAPFHMNFGCYFCGVVAALVYDKISSQQLKLAKYKSFQILWYLLIPVGVLWMFSAHPLIQHYYKVPPRFWGSVYAAMQRNSWSFGVAFMIVGMSARLGWILRRFACLPIFRILGRLTYGVLLIHIFMARIVLGTLREPIYFGTGTMFAYIFFNLTASYLASLILALLVELPTSSLLKLLR